MKLYDFGLAGSGKRVRVFLAEKNLDIPIVELNVRDGEQFKEPFNTLNPFHCVPFLELDDGSIIAESVSICRYLDELYPEPSLFGQSTQQRAVIDMWNRRIELDGYMPMLHAVRNQVPMFTGRVLPGTRNSLPQLPAVVDRGKDMLKTLLSRVDPLLANQTFIAGDTVSVADITAWFMMNMAATINVDFIDDYPNMRRWQTMFSARPSTQL